jgi:nucleotide-binding universal stress UspA family protein
MEIRTILAAVSGGSASAGVLELACRLARRFNSHLEAFHARLDPRELAFVAADGFGTPVIGNLIETAMQDAADAAAQARGLFDAAAKRHGLTLRHEPPPSGGAPALLAEASASWREAEGYSPAKISSRARLFDLVVLGRSGRVVDEPSSASVEEALLTTGRPVLIAPAEPPKRLGETIALAWNDSPECARALAAAMPHLARARAVHVLSVGDTGAGNLVTHLAWYGIRATVDAVSPVDGVGVGELLLAAARDHDADLMVMGAYGRAPWREMLLGGATRHVVGTSLLPLLLAH